MAIGEHLTTFLGKKVIDWKEGSQEKNLDSIVYRIRFGEYGSTQEGWTKFFDSFLKTLSINQISALVIGAWPNAYQNGSANIVQNLVSAADKLSNLKAIFLGDMTYEECEISWIQQSDMSPLLEAYPKLEYLAVRGGTGLEFSSIKHHSLKTLILQTGGLPKGVIDGIYDSQLPELEHLELWLGTDEYGADTSVKDLAPIFKGELFPKLKNLGLCNSQYQDDIAKKIVKAPILDNLEELNLSMGALTDKGVKELVKSAKIKKLKKLDIHHHFCSEEMMAKLEALGIEVDTSERLEPDADSENHYYISNAE